jgi:UDP-N-acetylmuramoyl-tripeptide--D-alanyl-D-alanine ligase
MAHGLGGRILGETRSVFTQVGIDSRSLPKGAAFVALRGERTDGHRYLDEALSRGAACLVLEKAPPSLLAKAAKRGAGVVRVADGLKALQSLAADQRRCMAVPVAGITGSNGKTGTKDLLAHILGQSQSVLSTAGNLNNHAGLPLTLLTAKPGQRAAVLEMGMNHAGELSALAEIARPLIGVVTNVGRAHLGKFKDQAGLAHAKAELVQALPSEGIAVLNADDLRTLAMLRLRPAGRWITFGTGPVAQLRALSIQDQGALGLRARLELRHPLLGSAHCGLRLQRGGLPALMNALAALSAALWMGSDLSQGAQALESAKPWGPLRLEIMPMARYKATALLDCYNASPESMKAALDYLAKTCAAPRRVLVLGSMLELGEKASALHQEIGRAAAALGARFLIGLGPHGADLCRGFGLQSAALDKGEHAAAAGILKKTIKPGDWVLVKGSRGMQMEKVIAFMQQGAV